MVLLIEPQSKHFVGEFAQTDGEEDVSGIISVGECCLACCNTADSFDKSISIIALREAAYQYEALHT